MSYNVINKYMGEPIQIRTGKESSRKRKEEGGAVGTDVWRENNRDETSFFN